MATASESELALCPGFGDIKVKRLREAIGLPFRVSDGIGTSAQSIGMERMAEEDQEAERALREVEEAGRDKSKGKEREVPVVVVAVNGKGKEREVVPEEVQEEVVVPVEEVDDGSRWKEAMEGGNGSKSKKQRTNAFNFGDSAINESISKG